MSRLHGRYRVTFSTTCRLEEGILEISYMFTSTREEEEEEEEEVEEADRPSH